MKIQITFENGETRIVEGGYIELNENNKTGEITITTKRWERVIGIKNGRFVTESDLVDEHNEAQAQ